MPSLHSTGAEALRLEAFNRLTSVTEGLASIQSMTYGPDGKRLSLTDSSGTRKFFYDGNDVIQEYNSDWSAVRMEYTHGPWVDEPLSMTDHVSREASDTHYLMKDRLGSIISILDENETVKTTYSYDAFGDPTATYHSGQLDCMYRFTGRVYDGAMGNYFYRARYYNQSLGRFFSRDPIFSLQSLYAYCGNSPTNFTDPFGLHENADGTHEPGTTTNTESNGNSGAKDSDGDDMPDKWVELLPGGALITWTKNDDGTYTARCFDSTRDRGLAVYKYGTDANGNVGYILVGYVDCSGDVHILGPGWDLVIETQLQIDGLPSFFADFRSDVELLGAVSGFTDNGLEPTIAAFLAFGPVGGSITFGVNLAIHFGSELFD
ncbi:MAG: RHS repeat-associated core domain-containing protein [Candidatus Coatesbacteria bacterium]|nr:RHS repeat-associated core domain-containing protein [Candidatus Coatesbacteria bacterium]